jgi:hypothetical protein
MTYWTFSGHILTWKAEQNTPTKQKHSTIPFYKEHNIVLPHYISHSFHEHHFTIMLYYFIRNIVEYIPVLE